MSMKFNEIGTQTINAFTRRYLDMSSLFSPGSYAGVKCTVREYLVLPSVGLNMLNFISSTSPDNGEPHEKTEQM